MTPFTNLLYSIPDETINLMYFICQTHANKRNHDYSSYLYGWRVLNWIASSAPDPVSPLYMYIITLMNRVSCCKLKCSHRTCIIRFFWEILVCQLTSKALLFIPSMTFPIKNVLTISTETLDIDL